MTGKPQQMSDRQDKSDDLIAELAKLMATTPDPQPKPAPRLVSDNAPKPAPPTIRIPGMDAPVSTGAAPKPVSPAPAPTPGAAAPSPFAVRIPGADRPVTAAPAPAAAPTAAPAMSTTSAAAAPAVIITPPPGASSAAASAPPATAAAKPATVRSFDFGALPPAAAIKPEPLTNWQDREIPKPVSVRPAVVETPKPAEPVPEATRLEPVAAEKPATEPKLVEEAPSAKAAIAESMKVDVPATSDFDFDFGLTSQAPTGTPAPAAVAAPNKPSVGSDPIAELIAAALDDDKPSAADPKTSFGPKAASPAPRAVPNTGASVGPVPLRPVGGSAPRIVPGGARPVSKIPVESDSFAEAPVFTAPEADKAPAAPVTAAKPELDPIDEIESLIGEAVRIGLQASEKPAPQPQPVIPVAASAPPATAPVVPPLTTGFAPRRAALKDPQPQVAPAEAAILAAAAASGAEISRANVNTAPNPYARNKAARDRRPAASTGNIRQYIGVAVAAMLLLAAGFGLYWVLGMGHGNDATAPVLTADTTPVKEAPPPAAPATDQQGAVVFNQMAQSNAPAGAAPVAPAEQLVSHDSSAETTVADVATTVGGDNAAASADSALANRKVRTVTVRPDGTIVSGDDSVAGSEALPVDRPNVPLLPGADVQKPTLLAAVPSAAPADPVAAAIKESDGTPEPSTQVAALVDPATTGTIDTNIVAPVPAPRPTDRGSLAASAKPPAPIAPAPTQPVNLLAAAPPAPVAVTPVKPAAPVPAPTNTASLSSGGAAAYVQLSSQKTQADAQTQLSRANSKWGSLFQGEKLEIQKAEVGTKGTFYRVRLPADSLQQATQICASIKANGGDCFPTNG